VRRVAPSRYQPAILLVFAALLSSLPGEVAREFVARNRHEDRVIAASAKTLLCRLATEARTHKLSGVRPLLERFLSLPTTMAPLLAAGSYQAKPLADRTSAPASHSTPSLFERPPPSLFLS